jgi:very-short-patch-repair endonuclease
MTEEFIQKAIEVHGDTYDYSKTEYVNALTKVIIICKEHGEFLQLPNSHKLGNGCRKCGFISTQTKRTMTNKEFIENSILVHGDKYDYSKTEYIHNLKEIIIICKEHGEFLQLPKTHKRGNGCIDCSLIARANKRTDTRETFIKKAILIHGNTYDYSKSEYKRSNKKIIIICKEHGEFLQSPNTHLGGAGCRNCANKNIGDKLRKTTIQFIEEAIKIHGDTYDYSKVEYKTTGEYIIIICPIHGDFEQTPNGHLSGRRCTICYSCHKLNTHEFIEKSRKIHGDRYDYSKVEYKTTDKEVIINCLIHGDFEQTPNSHLNGAGCQKCGYKSTIFSTNDFIQKSKETHGDKYNYSKSNYTKMSDQVIIICKKHGDFKQTPSNHITHKQGCPICINKTEAKLYENIISHYPNLHTQFKHDWCMKKSYLPYDFCIPEYKIIIELDGAQHFRQVRNWKSPEEQFENDKYKEECANQNGYSVIRLLQEDVFYDTYDWVKELCDAIEEVKSSEGITNVYLCKNYEYEQF